MADGEREEDEGEKKEKGKKKMEEEFERSRALPCSLILSLSLSRPTIVENHGASARRGSLLVKAEHCRGATVSKERG